MKGHWSTEAEFRPLNSDDNIRRPDVSLRPTDEAVSTSGIIEGMPDFCVDVKSPGNTYEELRDKDTLFGGDVLPRFKMPVSDIFDL